MNGSCDATGGFSEKREIIELIGGVNEAFHLVEESPLNGLDLERCKLCLQGRLAFCDPVKDFIEAVELAEVDMSMIDEGVVHLLRLEEILCEGGNDWDGGGRCGFE